MSDRVRSEEFPENHIEQRSLPTVWLSDRVAAVLLDTAGLREFFLSHRGRDRELDATLAAMQMVASARRVYDGGGAAALSAEEAAARIGITTRAVTEACSDGRLPAHRVGSRWVIAAEDADAYVVRDRKPFRAA